MEKSNNRFNLGYTLPGNSCNAHLHILDASYLPKGKKPVRLGEITDYKKIAERLHLQRAVFVQPKVYGTNHECLLHAIQEFGKERSVGIAVVHGDVSDCELVYLDQSGVCGLRFSVWNPRNAVVSFNDCLPLSYRIKDMGWNMQLHMGAAQLLENASTIEKLPCKVVIDHMGRLDPSLGTKDPAFTQICKWLDKGNFWVKLSGPYLNTKSGYPWEDATSVARAFVRYAPERLVWGSDYPHLTEKENIPEEVFVKQIHEWMEEESVQQKILVDNPQVLYGFK